MKKLEDFFANMRLIAILRGVTPEKVITAATILVEKGFTCIEVPLNSPRPFESIALLSKEFGKTCLIGAGTVINISDIKKVKENGGKLIIMPHCDPLLIREAKNLNLICIPGFSTATEAYQAIQYGADAIKFFPANALGIDMLKSIKAILPTEVIIIPTGGIKPEGMKGFIQAGAAGFGLGGELFKPEYSMKELAKRADMFLKLM